MDVKDFISVANKTKVNDWISINLNNYFKKDPLIDRGEVEHIIDFLNSEKAPKRIKYMSFEEAKAGAEKWTKTLIKKGSNIGESEKDIELVMNLPSGRRIVKLVGENAYKREGHLMKHCVGSYSNKKESTILSLRDEKNQPHCTIEIRDGRISQIKGKANQDVSQKYIDDVMCYLDNSGYEVSEYEMGYLGWQNLTKEEVEIIQTHFEGAVFKTIKGKTYINKNVKIKRIEQSIAV